MVALWVFSCIIRPWNRFFSLKTAVGNPPPKLYPCDSFYYIPYAFLLVGVTFSSKNSPPPPEMVPSLTKTTEKKYFPKSALGIGYLILIILTFFWAGNSIFPFSYEDKTSPNFHGGLTFLGILQLFWSITHNSYSSFDMPKSVFMGMS